MHILVVDDDSTSLKLCKEWLSGLGYDIAVASNGKAALKEIQQAPPSLAVLDLHLPDISGLEICKRLKEDGKTCGIPVIIFTGDDKEGLQVLCKRTGADAYLLKGCSGEVLTYCVKALMEMQSSCLPAQRLILGPVTLDPHERQVLVEQHTTPELTPQEFNLLALLMKESPRVVPWASILEKVWQSHESEPLYKAPNRIKVCLEKLRYKLGLKGSTCLVTHRSEGLQFLPT